MDQRSAPARPLRMCNHPGCNKVSTERYCPRHERVPWQHKRSVPRITGRALQEARRRLFDEEPHCRECLRNGRITPATERDHIIPLKRGGTDTRENTQALCAECHRQKSQAEAAAARGEGAENL